MEMDMIPTHHSFLNSRGSHKIQELQNELRTLECASLCLLHLGIPSDLLPMAPALVSSIKCTVKQLNRPESFNNLTAALCFCCP